MTLDNEIHIKCTPRGGENDVEMQYARHLTVSELVTTLELAKNNVVSIMQEYIQQNSITDDKEIDTIYWKMEIGDLL